MKQKRLFSLTVFTLLTTIGMQAQIVLWDGENQELGTQGGWWNDGTPTVVLNPQTDGSNPSSKCLSFKMTEANKVVKLPFRDWITPDMGGSRRISLMLLKETNENVKVELSDPTNGASGYWENVAAWYGSQGKWQKIVFDYSTNTGVNDFPGVMGILVQTGTVTGEQTVYIDNIVIEPLAKVGDVSLKDITDGSLTGDVKVEGALMQGTCANINAGWIEVKYNDFEILNNKLGADVTSVDIRGAVLKDAYNPTRSKNPNLIMFTDKPFVENESGDANVNVVVEGRTALLELNENNTFAAPENFIADKIKLNRKTYSGTNTFCLPFYIGEELGGTLAVYEEQTADKVNFSVVDYVDANFPFIAIGLTASEELEFFNKSIVATPVTLGNDFVGVYRKQSAKDLYGIGTDDKFVKGGENATICSFHSYLNVKDNSPAKVLFINDVTEVSDIHSITAKQEDVYTITGMKAGRNLKRGVYIRNNKKFIVR